MRVYGPFPNPSLMVRDEYNDCNYKGANNVRIGDEPVAVNAPYRGETDDEEGHPVLAAPGAPDLKSLVYEDKMRDYLIMMDMNSIVGRITMICLGALLECLFTPPPGWPRWTVIVGKGVRA